MNDDPHDHPEKVFRKNEAVEVPRGRRFWRWGGGGGGGGGGHLVHLPLLQKEFQHDDEVAHWGKAAHELCDQLGCLGAVGNVKANVKGKPRADVIKLYDGDFCTRNDLHVTFVV
jgi:hypothetical protein